MKAAFVILTLFTGPLGAFFYVLGCREPIKGTHAQYVSVTWRQVLGSTMHCAAGDGLGIIIGSAIGLLVGLAVVPNFFLGYVLGFSFGWAYFQAFAMRDMAGGEMADMEADMPDMDHGEMSMGGPPRRSIIKASIISVSVLAATVVVIGVWGT